MKTLAKLFTILFAILVLTGGYAQEVSQNSQVEIQQQLENLRTAHLKSDAKLADLVYHPSMILTSQSGTKYNKEAALKNIENTFEYYENSEIEFLELSNTVVLTNYINERKYKDFDKGRFRLTVVWTKQDGTWQIISMQSSKIKQRTKN